MKSIKEISPRKLLSLVDVRGKVKEVVSLPQLPALLIEVAVVGPSTQLFLRELSLRMLPPTSLLVELPLLSPPSLRRRGSLWRLLLVEG